MALINVTDLTFCYEGSYENIFEHVSFSIDTKWKLGFIGRNGKGKTTFLSLLQRKYSYQGSITSPAVFDYFPCQPAAEQMQLPMAEMAEELKAGCELWRVICELDQLGASAELLYRPFETLSHGERTKVMLAVLFSGENDFLLIDEPTNHLDEEARDCIREYLKLKKGFILVSHDRELLDSCVDHVLVLNRRSLEVQSGNFSSWWENKRRMDQHAQSENEKHLREIAGLKRAAEQNARWAQKSENSKIGFDPVREHDRSISTRAYIGAKTKKLQSRVKQFEGRMNQAIEEKEGLLQDIENPVALKLEPQKYHKDILITASDYCLHYQDSAQEVLNRFCFELRQGERVFLHGKNGCGKSSFLKAVLAAARQEQQPNITTQGILTVGSGLKISYVNQDTGFLSGSIREFCRKRELEESLFCALLRQLDLERIQFTKNLEDFSEGQKKKVLIAASLMTPAHLYLWDEPLNFIDIFSRMQIEELLLKYQPTMLVVEHDLRMREKIATRIVEM